MRNGGNQIRRTRMRLLKVLMVAEADALQSALKWRPFNLLSSVMACIRSSYLLHRDAVSPLVHALLHVLGCLAMQSFSGDR